MGYVEDLRAELGHRPLILNGSVVIIENAEGKILLQERNENRHRWGLPGGLMELGEKPEETAIREVFEETSLTLANLKLLDVYTTHELSLAENGDRWQSVTMCYYSKDYSGNLLVDKEESLQFKWTSLEEIPENFVKNYKKMLEDYKKVVKHS